MTARSFTSLKINGVEHLKSGGGSSIGFPIGYIKVEADAQEDGLLLIEIASYRKQNSRFYRLRRWVVKHFLIHFGWLFELIERGKHGKH